MKKTPVIYISIILGALALGGLGGMAYKRLFGEKNYEITGFSEDSLKEDMPSLMARYAEYRGTNVARDFTPSELINIGLENYRNAPNSYSFGIGSSTGTALGIQVNQSIRSYQIRNDNLYFEESISDSSFVHLGSRMLQAGIGADIEVLNTESVVPPDFAHFPSAGAIYSAETYKATFGRTITEMFIYIISNKTDRGSEVEVDSNGDYKIKISLETMFSTYNYKLQMKNLSNLDAYPNFQYVSLEFTLTKQLMLKQMHVLEAFTATKAGMSPIMTNDITYYYHANEYVPIPEYNEPCDYTLI